MASREGFTAAFLGAERTMEAADSGAEAAFLLAAFFADLVAFLAIGFAVVSESVGAGSEIFFAIFLAAMMVGRWVKVSTRGAR